MRQLAIAALFLSLAAPVATTRAQDRSGEATTYDFMDELVEGGRYSHDGESIQVGRRRARQTLITARAHFIPELVKSVEHL